MTTEAELGAMWPQASNTWSHQKLEEAGRTHPPAEPRREHGPTYTLNPGFWPPEPAGMDLLL